LLHSLRRRAYKKECSNSLTPESISTHGNFVEAIEATTGLQENEAQAFADEVLQSQDPMLRLSGEALSLAPDVLNHILCTYSLEYFGKTYLAHHFKHSFCDALHTPMLRMIREAETHETSRPTIIMSWPESGKSTCVGVLLPVHNIVFGATVELPNGKQIDRQKKYIMFVCADNRIALKAMHPTVHELENNDSIREDFGEFYRDPDRRVGREGPWTRTHVLTRNGVFIEAKSRRTKFLSSKWISSRPDLGIVSDIDDESVDTRGKRTELFEWFITTFLSRFDRDNGNVIVEGNKQHDMSLIARLYDYGLKHKWNVREFKAYQIDEETGKKVYTWPEQFGPEWEKRTRETTITASAFEHMYLHNTAEGEAEISREDIVMYNVAEVLGQINSLVVFIAMDPAISQKVHADYTAIVPIAFDPATGITYVLETFNKRIDLIEQGRAFINTWARYGDRVARLGTESVGYQLALNQYITHEASKLGATLPVEEIRQDKSLGKKHYRIRRIFGAIRDGRIRFNPSDENQVILIDQLLMIAKGGEPEHDDLADALEMADRLKTEYYTSQITGGSAEAEILRPLTTSTAASTGLGRFGAPSSDRNPFVTHWD